MEEDKYNFTDEKGLLVHLGKDGRLRYYDPINKKFGSYPRILKEKANKQLMIYT